MNNDIPTPSADEKVETPTITVEYIESGTFVGGEEDVFNANIKTGDECVVMSKAAFVLLAADRKKEREELKSETVSYGLKAMGLETRLSETEHNLAHQARLAGKEVLRNEALVSELQQLRSEIAETKENWRNSESQWVARERDWTQAMSSLRSELQSAQKHAIDKDAEMVALRNEAGRIESIAHSRLLDNQSLTQQLQTAMEERDSMEKVLQQISQWRMSDDGGIPWPAFKANALLSRLSASRETEDKK